MVAGHLREQNGYYQMILSWKGNDGKRKGKSISTGLPVKGNKKRAEKLLLKTRSEFNPDNIMEDTDILFPDFLVKWLRDEANKLAPRLYANYAYAIKSSIVPYFEKHPVSLLKLTARELENYYRYERQENEATAQDLLEYHDAIKAALDYAVQLDWLQSNLAEPMNPCADEAPILFTDFILEWLEMMRNSVEMTTYSAYANTIKGSIIPYFKDKNFTLQDLEKHPKHIQDYYQFELNAGKTANTVIHRHANIRKCLQYAFQIGLIKSNPADRIERPRKAKYVATIYDQQELDTLFKTVEGDPIELGVILAAFYGLRRSEVVGLKWDAIDFEKKTISIRHTVTQVNIDGKSLTIQKDRTKTKSSCRTLPLVAPFEALLHRLKAEQQINQKVCGAAYCKDYLDYIYVNPIGELVKPNFLTQHFEIVLKNNGLKKIRFHDLRHSCASLLQFEGDSGMARS